MPWESHTNFDFCIYIFSFSDFQHKGQTNIQPDRQEQHCGLLRLLHNKDRPISKAVLKYYL